MWLGTWKKRRMRLRKDNNCRDVRDTHWDWHWDLVNSVSKVDTETETLDNGIKFGNWDWDFPLLLSNFETETETLLVWSQILRLRLRPAKSPILRLRLSSNMGQFHPPPPGVWRILNISAWWGLKYNLTTIQGCAEYVDECAAFAEGCAAYAEGCAAYAAGCAAYMCVSVRLKLTQSSWAEFGTEPSPGVGETRFLPGY